MKILNNAYLHFKNACLKQNLGEKKYQEYRENLKQYVDICIVSTKHDLLRTDIEQGLTDRQKRRLDLEKKIMTLTDFTVLDDIKHQYNKLKYKYLLDHASIQKVKNDRFHFSISNTIASRQLVAMRYMADEIF
jgi:hypothetical protein